jgi:hypothetical protein
MKSAAFSLWPVFDKGTTFYKDKIRVNMSQHSSSLLAKCLAVLFIQLGLTVALIYLLKYLHCEKSGWWLLPAFSTASFLFLSVIVNRVWR